MADKGWEADCLLFKRSFGIAAIGEAANIGIMIDARQAIVDLLREKQGVASRKLTPSARLTHDLGVDGDDAAELFQDLHEWFGTDFSALNAQWTEFFHTEGMSPRSMLAGLLLMVPSTALALWIGITFSLSTAVGGTIAVAIFFAFCIAAGKLFPGKQRRPVTIEGLAEIVRDGAWPTDPEKVR